MREFSIELTQRIKIPVNQTVMGVTKLRNEIYILCQSTTFPHTIIRVFLDQTPFSLHMEIEINQITSPFDIGSCEKEYCLYICDSVGKFVWKITRDADHQHKVTKWLTTYYEPRTLSVSCDGQLLMINDSSPSLMTYGSDAELIRSVPLPIEIKNPQHAVKTSIGNIIIIHSGDEDKAQKKEENEDDDERTIGGRRVVKKFVLSELTSDGQMVIRRFIPSDETQKLYEPCYLSLDSDDRVFLADRGNDRVILLDFNLKWNRILCTTREGKDNIWLPYRLCYDEEMKLLIVIGETATGINVYTLSRI